MFDKLELIRGFVEVLTLFVKIRISLKVQGGCTV